MNHHFYYLFVVFVATTILFVTACQPSADDKSSSANNIVPVLAEGRWRAIFQLDDDPDPSTRLELPFNFDLTREQNQYTMHLINADERIEVKEFEFPTKDSVVIKLPYYHSEIRVRINERRMIGAWYNLDKGADYYLPIYAVFDDSTRFHVPTTDSIIQVAGKWEVTFIAEDKSGKTDAIGEFKQNGNRVTGTFITPTGDYRYLEGIATDHELMLSCFDGAHAYLFVAGISESGDLNGDAWYGKHGRDIWLGYRNEEPTLPMNGQLSEMKEDDFSFSFPDVTGKTIANNDAQFKDKVVLVQIMGTWCPNCLDETKLLVELYQKYHSKGLEIVALAFERSNQLATAAPILQRYISQTGIQYPVLLAGSSDKKMASAVLPQLDAVKAFPTLLLLQRTGKVKNIFTGISGPATSEYATFVGDLEAIILQELNQPSGVN